MRAVWLLIIGLTSRTVAKDTVLGERPAMRGCPWQGFTCAEAPAVALIIQWRIQVFLFWLPPPALSITYYDNMAGVSEAIKSWGGGQVGGGNWG